MKKQLHAVALVLAAVVVAGCSGADAHHDTPNESTNDDGGTFSSIPNPAILIAEGGGESISILDPSSLAVIGTVPVASSLHPHHISIAPDGSRVLVVATSADLSAGHSGGHGSEHGSGHAAASETKVYLLDVASRELRSIISVDAVAHNAAFMPDVASIALGMMEHGMVAIYDATTFEETRTILGLNMPLEVTPTSAGQLLVAESGGGTVALCDPATGNISSRFEVGIVPVAAWASGGGDYFVSVEGDMELRHLVEVSGGVELDEHEIDPSGTPGQAMLTSDGAELWVAVEDAGLVAIIDATTHERRAEVVTGGKPHGIVFEPTGTRAFITDEDRGLVLVVDVQERVVTSEITVGAKPNGIAWLAR